MEERPDYNLFHVVFVLFVLNWFKGLKTIMVGGSCHFHSHAHSGVQNAAACCLAYKTQELTLIMFSVFPPLFFSYPLLSSTNLFLYLLNLAISS